MSLALTSSVRRISISLPCASGMTSASSLRSRGVLTPETTSSPWALIRKSPEGAGAPVTSSRLKATPVAEVSPLLPKTICCTLTAVPQSSGIRLILRYWTARSPIQESNTARIGLAQLLPRILGELVEAS